MTQKEMLLDHFINGGTLTVLESIEKFGVYALSQRCGELRRAGHPIDSDLVATPTGKHVSMYYYRVPFAE